jgi:DNA-directed RNA polymerase II subunit RPB2
VQIGNVIKATIPYIKVDIPIWVVFRALGVISDRDILEHICYDMQDSQMLEMLKPCIDDGFVIQDREVRIIHRHQAYSVLIRFCLGRA